MTSPLICLHQEQTYVRSAIRMFKEYYGDAVELRLFLKIPRSESVTEM